jgi:hypothetical protein
MATRNPDLVNEAFRQYGIDFGIERVGRVFREEDVPVSMGTPDGAAALRRTLETLKKEPMVWLTDVEAVVHPSDSQAD